MTNNVNRRVGDAATSGSLKIEVLGRGRTTGEAEKLQTTVALVSV